MTPAELAHQQRVASYLAKIKRLWEQATEEAAAMAGNLRGYDPTKPFNIINYPQTSKEMNRIISELHDQTQFLIEEGIDLEWYNANKDNDRLVKNWSKNKPRPPEQWMQHNEDARDAFKLRKQAGMNLSERVWKITDSHKTSLEMAIDMSLYDGKSAQLLSQDIRNSLNEPNRLFRRVRDARGNLQLSKAAQGYHSGRGVYRSSYKNAMRVARTEHNLAYRYSDFYRTAQLDFVLGFEVHLSNNHTINGVPFVDICDDLKGKYPKGFKFGGWHPQCRCYMTQILMDEDEFDMIEDKMLAGENISGYVSPNTIWDTPKGFNDWVKQNTKRSEGWKSQPYWVMDNFKGGTLRGGLQIGKAVPPVPKAPDYGGLNPEYWKQERGWLYDKDGNLLEFSNTGEAGEWQANVTFSNENMMRADRLIHTHPDLSMFSPDDLTHLWKNKVTDLKVVHSNGDVWTAKRVIPEGQTYSDRVKLGIANPKDVKEYWDVVENDIFNHTRSASMTAEEIIAECNTRVAAKFGITLEKSHVSAFRGEAWADDIMKNIDAPKKVPIPVPEPPPVPKPLPKPVFPDTFVPAQSIDDALSFGNKTLGIEFEGDFTLEQLNAINKGHWRVKRALGENWTLDINKYKAQTTEEMKWMMARRDGNTLLLNKKNFNDKTLLDHYHANQIQSAENAILELKTKLQQYQYTGAAERAQIEANIRSWELQLEEWRKTPSFIARNPEEYIIGELGKDVRYKLSPHGLTVEVEARIQLIAREEGLLISEYASTGGIAYTEEAWVAYLRGEFYKINPELKAVFDKAVRVKPIEIKAPIPPKPKPEPPPVPKPVPAPAPKELPKDFEWQNSIKDAQKWAEDAGFAEGVWYDGMTIDEANEVNRTLWELQKKNPLKKLKKISSIDQDGLYSEFDTLGFDNEGKMLINIREIRKAHAARKNLHAKIREEIKQLEDRLAELKKAGYRKYTASYNKRIEDLKLSLKKTPEWKSAADIEMEYFWRLSDVVTSARMELQAQSAIALDTKLVQKMADRMTAALNDRDYRMQYTVKAFHSYKDFINESYILYRRGHLKDPYTIDLIEEIIDTANGRVHIPAKIAPPPVVKKPWDTKKSIHDQLESLTKDEDFQQWADEVLNVTDLWVGLKPESKRQIFEEFYNLRTEYGFKRRMTFGWESRQRAYASASSNTYNIKKSWWNDPEKLEVQFASDVRVGWHPQTAGVGTVGGKAGRLSINRHEFGHVLTSGTLHFSAVPEFNVKINAINRAYRAKKKEAFAVAKEEMAKNSERVNQLWKDRNNVYRNISKDFDPTKVDEAIKKIDDEVGVLQKRNMELQDWMDNPKEDWFVSRYADENIHEFAAECFAYSFEPNCPNTFAMQVRALIDEYFKGNL